MAAALVLSTMVVSAQQADGGKPIRIIVPYAAGGLIDVMSRIVGARMAMTLGHPVIVDDRPGANANIGSMAAMQAAPDGLTLLASASYFTINPVIEKNLPWSPRRLTAIARIAVSPNVVTVPGSSPNLTMRDFIAAAKATPGMPVAEAGAGAPQTMVTELLQHAAGVKFTAVNYKGGTSYVPDLVNGTLAMGVIPINVALGLVKSGQLRALAITGSRRSPALPDVPTMAEAGFAQAGVDSWVGFHVPAGTAPEIIERLASAVKGAVAHEDVKARLENLGASGAYLDPPAFESFLREDTARAELFVRLLEMK
jgi:tripartite-type tricarboxylate transporter receptor subunit TctC